MNNFKDFIVTNGIVSTAASITIGFATATFIKSFVADMILPLLFLIFVGGTSKISKNTGSFFAQFLSNKEFRYTNFIAEAITWILIIFSSYLILEYVVLKTLQYKLKMPVWSEISQHNPFAPQQQKQAQQ